MSYIIGKRGDVKVGDKVICGYRLPRITQWWVGINGIHVGEVIEAGDKSTAGFDAANYCKKCDRVAVRYKFGVMYEHRLDLVKVSFEQTICFRNEIQADNLIEQAHLAFDLVYSR